MPLQLRLILAGVLLLPIAGGAQVQGDAPEETANLRSVTAAEYKGHVESLKALVAACEKNPAECDAKKVGDDERVEGGGFQTRWSWLRDALSTAHDPASPDRAKLLQQAATRLDEDDTLANASNAQSADAFQRARKQADDVLSRPEFRDCGGAVVSRTPDRKVLAVDGQRLQRCLAVR